MASGFVIRRNQYYDSLFLMGVNKKLLEEKGVQQTAVLMASPANKALLEDIGIRDTQIDAAKPNDLVVAVVAETQAIVEALLGKLDSFLVVSEEASQGTKVRTLEAALAEKPAANLAVISVPGEYAAREAQTALQAGLNVFLFSDNVAIADELELKQYAVRHGLLVMGPDCGTSIIGGKGIGFANVVRGGVVSVIGAAGTGLQEFTSQVHNAGQGIRHAIGTGSHDLSDAVGGLTTFSALQALEEDARTKVIAFVSKPPGENTLKALVERFQQIKKPVVGCFLGVREKLMGEGQSFIHVDTIDEAVDATLRALKVPDARRSISDEKLRKLALAEGANFSGEQRFLRGIFAGGTFCYQAQQIFRDAGISVHSNTPLEKQYGLDHPDHSIDNTIVDMGDDLYMRGKPHPMIDGTMRRLRILAEGRDPRVAILFLDIILGYNSSKDPAGELAEAITEVKYQATKRGGYLCVVASVCGTDGDPQDRDQQEKILREAGATVFDSNARATKFCIEVLKQGEMAHGNGH
jgi:FdrA protein